MLIAKSWGKPIHPYSPPEQGQPTLLKRLSSGSYAPLLTGQTLPIGQGNPLYSFGLLQMNGSETHSHWPEVTQSGPAQWLECTGKQEGEWSS